MSNDKPKSEDEPKKVIVGGVKDSGENLPPMKPRPVIKVPAQKDSNKK